jgi:hypothetical protein
MLSYGHRKLIVIQEKLIEGKGAIFFCALRTNDVLAMHKCDNCKAYRHIFMSKCQSPKC